VNEWKDNIKMGYEGMDRIHTQDRDQ